MFAPGLSPVRDYGPRLVAWIGGWGNAAFPDQSGGFFWVYILGPMIGAGAAALFLIYAFEPTMGTNTQKCNCKAPNK